MKMTLKSSTPISGSKVGEVLTSWQPETLHGWRARSTVQIWTFYGTKKGQRKGHVVSFQEVLTMSEIDECFSGRPFGKEVEAWTREAFLSVGARALANGMYAFPESLTAEQVAHTIARMVMEMKPRRTGIYYR